MTIKHDFGTEKIGDSRSQQDYSFERLEMLWERYPQYHEMSAFASLDELLMEHDSWRKDLSEELLEEYINSGYDRFLVNLSWADLPYRYATKELLEEFKIPDDNPYVSDFMEQFSCVDTDTMAAFIFPESYVSHFFVVKDVCRKAVEFRPVNNLFPDEERISYLAVFDKKDIDDILLMYHLLYTSSSQEIYGGYSLYDYSLTWYQTHLMEQGVVLRSPYLPDRLAKYQGALPYYHNPAKTVYVRRNIDHILKCGYFSSELEFFVRLTRDIMPVFQWWYEDIAMYENQDGIRTDWKLRRTEIRTRLTAEGVIRPKWKNELTLFHLVRDMFPDTLYQYRPEWLGQQSVDLYIPSENIAIEYQGIQHYQAVDFFGGDEALEHRKALDEQKRALCTENGVRLIEWHYDMDPTKGNLRKVIESEESKRQQ